MYTCSNTTSFFQNRYMKQIFITDIYSSIVENNNFVLKIPLSQNLVEKAKNRIRDKLFFGPE